MTLFDGLGSAVVAGDSVNLDVVALSDLAADNGGQQRAQQHGSQRPVTLPYDMDKVRTLPTSARTAT